MSISSRKISVRNETDGDEASKDDELLGQQNEEVEEDEASAQAQLVSVAESEDVSEIDPEKMGPEGSQYLTLQQRKRNLMKTAEILETHDVVVQKLINKARDDLVWEQYMKCDGLPDPVCVRELNTYLSLWKEDTREDIDTVLVGTFLSACDFTNFLW